MNPDHQALLNQLADKPERSKLAPYRDLIRSLRQKRYTFREIAQLLEIHYALKVDHSTIVDFTKRRSNQCRLDLTSEGASSNALVFSPTQSTEPSHSTTIDRTRKRFHYDPEEGLTLSDEALNLKPKKD